MKEDPDLFVWADQRPTAQIINFIPHIARKIWRERHLVPVLRDAKLIVMADRREDGQRKAG